MIERPLIVASGMPSTLDGRLGHGDVQRALFLQHYREAVRREAFTRYAVWIGLAMVTLIVVAVGVQSAIVLGAPWSLPSMIGDVPHALSIMVTGGVTAIALVQWWGLRASTVRNDLRILALQLGMSVPRDDVQDE